MRGQLTIQRGSTTLADGNLSLVQGCPLAECEHLLDVVNYIRASESVVLDRLTKQTRIDFMISREFGSIEAALHHAFMEPAATTGRNHLVINYDNGTNVFTWTLANAGWSPARVQEVVGVRTLISYSIVGGAFTAEIGALLTEEGGGLLAEDGSRILL